MIILVTGGTGFIGRALCEKLKQKGHELRILSRTENLSEDIYGWNYKSGEINPKALQGVEGIIHLAGASVSERWTDAYKEEMYNSRIQTLQFLEKALQAEGISKLQFLLSASGVNYYGTETTLHTYKESDPAGDDFLAKLCMAWEKAAEDFQIPTERKAIFRTSVVLDTKGGAIAQMLPFFKIGMGTIMGSGKQWMPSISLEDIADLYVFGMENKWSGTYNAVGFNIRQKDFAKQLGKKLNKPVLMKIPSFVLQWGMGEMSAILLKGSAVSNEKIIQEGFELKNPSFESISVKA